MNDFTVQSVFEIKKDIPMQCTNTSFTDRLHLAYSYVEQWHGGVSVPVNVSAVDHIKGISRKVQNQYRGAGCEEAAIAACLYKGMRAEPPCRNLLNNRTKETGDGDNTMDTVLFLFGKRVGGLISELNTAPVKCPTVEFVEWACFISQPAQAVVLAKNWQSFEDRVQDISDSDTALRLVYYCTNRFKTINRIWNACPELARSAKRVGRRLLDGANAYLRANDQYRGRD